MVAAQQMKSFIENYYPGSMVSFEGSILIPSDLDVFSDVDMKITLSKNTPVNMKELITALSERFNNIFGYEIHNNSDADVLRVCFENGWRFDLTFIRPGPQAPQTEQPSFFDNIDATMNLFWFLSSMVLVKLGRKDYLIAAHLALELCQLNIVMQMLARDEDKKTHIHRFGDSEDVPVLYALTSLNSRRDRINNGKDEILKILFLSAEHMDKITASIKPGYIFRLAKLNDLYKSLNSPV